jgi:hypothetical protein
MEDRTRRILFGAALTAGALALSATTAGAQSTGSSDRPAPRSTQSFDDGPSQHGSMAGGCSGMDGGTDTGDGGAAAAAQLT